MSNPKINIFNEKSTKIAKNQSNSEFEFIDKIWTFDIVCMVKALKMQQNMRKYIRPTNFVKGPFCVQKVYFDKTYFEFLITVNAPKKYWKFRQNMKFWDSVAFFFVAFVFFVRLV